MIAGNIVRVGCAGWSIGSRDAQHFGAGESGLQRYATRFPVVEINTSFYRPHQPKTYERWAAAVPAEFRFSVKVPRLISHELRLRGTGPALDRFLDEAGHLGSHLGGLLVQLPPSLVLDAHVAATFFQMLRRRTAVPVVCEPRHASWFTDRAEALLVSHDIARAGVDPARVAEAAVPAGARTWCYRRWHGSPRIYYSDYPENALAELAAAIARDRGTAPRWVIFDNTAHGFAVANALRLQALLSGTPVATAAGEEMSDA